MKVYRVGKSGPLRGEVVVPGDKSIGHRSLLFAALAEGESIVHGLSGGLDNQATAKAFRQMGVSIDLEGTSARISGVGLDGLRRPEGDLDCGNSGTTMRLLAGLLSVQPFRARLVGDASLTRRPMGRVVRPLQARGASIQGASGAKPSELYPPLQTGPREPGKRLLALEHDSSIASAQVKSAVLLSGLYADTFTAYKEPYLSRDHTERMMLALGVPLQTFGPMVMLDPEGWSRRWNGFEWTVPGDFSSAAFPMVAALVVEGSDVHVEGVGVNPTRTGLLDALRHMSAGVDVVPQGVGAGDEPTANVRTESRRVPAVCVGGELLVRMLDEIPIFCALAAVARGRTEIRDASELRAKESDRIAMMAQVLKAFGVPVEEFDDGLAIEGGAELRPARVRSDGDHRIAMSAAVLAMAAPGESIIEDVACVETSFPGFAEMMRKLGADIEESEAL